MRRAAWRNPWDVWHFRQSTAVAGSALSSQEKPTMPKLRIGMLLFPRMTQLDLTGPFEVFSRRARRRGAAAVEDARTGRG